MQGWIKLHRKLLKWEWYLDSKMVHLFLHLVLLANHEEGRWQGLTIKRGMVVTGLRALHKATGISIQSIRTCLKKLENTGELTSTSTNKYRIITLCNYKDYQSNGTQTNKQSNKQSTSKQQTTNKQPTPNKNVKNVNNEKTDKKEYDEFVFLTEKEHSRLIEQFGESGTLARIKNLNDGIGSKGYKYKSHYHTILSWDRKDTKDKPNTAPPRIETAPKEYLDTYNG